MLWKDGYHRKAIETIKGAIAANVFVSHDNGAADVTDSMSVSSKNQNQNMLAARVSLSMAYPLWIMALIKLSRLICCSPSGRIVLARRNPTLSCRDTERLSNFITGELI